MDIDHERRLTEVESRSKSNMRRLDNVEKRQDSLDELVGTVKVLAVKEDNIEKKVDKISDNVESITAKSAKRWDGLVDKIILTIAAAVIGFVLAKFGLGG